MDTVTTSLCSERLGSHPALLRADPEGCGPGVPGASEPLQGNKTVVSPTPHPRCPVSAGHPGPASPLLAPVAEPLEYLQLSHRI